MTDRSDVRTQLRDAILRGDYAPRQRLIEADLAEEYSASRFNVRNALIQLASEGLVELQPNRGARVREITVTEAIEITEVRQAVESGALMQYSELNTTLHATLREIADHSSANRMLEQLNGQMVRHQFRLFLVPGRPSQSLPEHLAIIDAVCRRDPQAASAAMGTHVASVITTLMSFAQPAPTP